MSVEPDWIVRACESLDAENGGNDEEVDSDCMFFDVYFKGERVAQIADWQGNIQLFYIDGDGNWNEIEKHGVRGNGYSTERSIKSLLIILDKIVKADETRIKYKIYF